MELTVQHSTFTGVISMDLKFTSVDTRVTQLLGFKSDDLVGQNIFDFFHPKEYYRSEHFVCWKKLMYQGRATSPVYRFLTKTGEWIWMQMSATLTYVPNTKTPYAANYIFRVINAEKETGKYKLVEHSEEYVMESNSCLSDEIKPHFPQPLDTIKERPKENENHVINSLHDTPLSEAAREAFFQARNIGMDTFISGLQPARLENGVEPVQMIPDYTENATLDSVFVPPTMSCTGAIPYGPDLYVPSKSGSTKHTQSSTSVSSLTSSPASNDLVKSTFPNDYQSEQLNNDPNLLPESLPSYNDNTSKTHSPSFGYVSSSGEQLMPLDHGNAVLTSSQQLENHSSPLHNNYSAAPNFHKSLYQNASDLWHEDFNSSAIAASLFDDNISLSEIDPSILNSLTAFDSEENSGADVLNQWSDKTGNITDVLSSQSQVSKISHDNYETSPFNYVNSSIDEIIDQLLVQMPPDDGVNSYPEPSGYS